MKLLFTFVFCLTVTVGICGHSTYSYKTYGKLKAKIEHSSKDRTTDKAFKCAQFCSYLTNQLLPHEQVYLEVYTMQNRECDDFFASYGNGLIHVYRNSIVVNRKGNKTPVRELFSSDSLETEKLVIRYISEEPNFEKLTCYVYSCIQNLEEIKLLQKEVRYKRQFDDWIFRSIDTTLSEKWVLNREHNEEIVKLTKGKVFHSGSCITTLNKFTYKENDSSFVIYHKNMPQEINFSCDDIPWFQFVKEYGVFFVSDTSVVFTDSQHSRISEEYFLPIRLSDYKYLYLLKESSYAIKLSMMFPVKEDNEKPFFSVLYRPVEQLFFDTSHMNESQVIPLTRKKLKN